MAPTSLTMAALLGKLPTISQHLKRSYADNELEREATVKSYLMVQIEGACAKPRNMCRDCSNRLPIPLSDAVISQDRVDATNRGYDARRFRGFQVHRSGQAPDLHTRFQSRTGARS